MTERRRSQSQDRRADLGVGYDLDTEDVRKPRSTVVTESSEDEVLALLIEDEDTGEHAGRDCTSPPGPYGFSL